MIGRHLTDSEIQQLAFEPGRQSAEILNHLHSCPGCTSKLQFYTGYFSSLSQMPKPEFDFDLSAAVLNRITQKNKAPNRFIQIVIFIVLATGVSFLTYWIFRKYLHELFTGFYYMVIFLLLAAILSFLCFQLWEIWRRYQQKIDALNLY
jgi:hypothetical protein